MGPQFDLRTLHAQQQINDALGVRPQPQQVASVQRMLPQANPLAALAARYQMRPR